MRALRVRMQALQVQSIAHYATQDDIKAQHVPSHVFYAAQEHRSLRKGSPRVMHATLARLRTVSLELFYVQTVLLAIFRLQGHPYVMNVRQATTLLKQEWRSAKLAMLESTSI